MIGAKLDGDKCVTNVNGKLGDNLKELSGLMETIWFAVKRVTDDPEIISAYHFDMIEMLAAFVTECITEMKKGDQDHGTDRQDHKEESTC